MNDGKIEAVATINVFRLAAFFDTDVQSWMHMQNHYDTEVARQAMRQTLRNIERHRLVSR